MHMCLAEACIHANLGKEVVVTQLLTSFLYARRLQHHRPSTFTHWAAVTCLHAATLAIWGA